MNIKLTQEKLFQIYQCAKLSKEALSQDCSTGKEIEETTGRMDAIIRLVKELSKETIVWFII